MRDRLRLGEVRTLGNVVHSTPVGSGNQVAVTSGSTTVVGEDLCVVWGGTVGSGEACKDF